MERSRSQTKLTSQHSEYLFSKNKFQNFTKLSALLTTHHEMRKKGQECLMLGTIIRLQKKQDM
jgi:hypothetical protein